MKAFEECLKTLEIIDHTSLRFHSKSDLITDMLPKFISIYEALSRSEREELFYRVSSKLGMKLVYLGSLAAERAIDLNSVEWIKYGIVMHILEGFRTDYRENIRNLIFLYYASNELGFNFKNICKGLLVFAKKDVQNKFEDFFCRDPKLNDLRAFGVKVEKKNNRTRFVSI
ncbi:hypothetical protein [Spartinivicinus poritis]|uniref:Uncharacterized protein n=1 Tax=Spartinivicinus poritis TaxID=2994640 RepID=A0ABT5UHD2_9GAMM|nr:hypothetical protein [Spartinivicinus sp. A2-2]MDE1465722.1 hypothetical protein [Spartinivicinus sp. A2-2]